MIIMTLMILLSLLCCGCVISSTVTTTTLLQASLDKDIADIIIQRQKAATTTTSRAERFPSIDARVRLYMSNWYHPPCENYSNGLIRYSYHDKSNHHHQDSYSNKNNNSTVVLHLFSSYRRPHVTSRYINHSKSNDASYLVQLDYYWIEPIIQPDQVFYVNRKLLLDCARTDQSNIIDSLESSMLSSSVTNHTEQDKLKKMKLLNRNNMRMYCKDTLYSLQEAWDHVVGMTEDIERHAYGHDDSDGDVPLLLQYGDMETTHIYGILELPHIKKFRSAVVLPNNMNAASSLSSSVLSSLTCLQQPPTPLATVHGSHILQPIIWKLATHRHYRQLPFVYRHDTPWPLKRNQAIFRGQLTGALEFFNKSLSHYDNCMQSRRCQLVYHHAHSSTVNAKLTSTRSRLPSFLDGINMTSPAMSIRQLLQYKAIIMLEGNDVASGLKWALLSQSVVLMPTPQHTSWAMEELLQPWVVRVIFCYAACDHMTMLLLTCNLHELIHSFLHRIALHSFITKC
jgi:hypothetical protein